MTTATEARHTPGPWVIDGPAGYANHPGCMVYAPHGSGHLVAMCPPGNADNQPANARLIATAPQLLEACIEAEQAMTEEIEMADLEDDDNHYLAPTRELIRAAIAAATK